MPEFDYLVVGAGLFGATFAREMLDAGRSVLIVDQRPAVGGNCRTEDRGGGVHLHCHGPHIFHTRSDRIWRYVNRFAEFNHFRLHGRARVGHRVYSMPPGLALFHELWGCSTPAEARREIEARRIPSDRPANFEAFILNAVGREVYERFYAGYTRKQWGRDPSEVPVAVGRRLPVRLDWSTRWFDDPHEGIPVRGYTALIENLLDGATVETGVEFGPNRRDLARRARRVVYTGKIDEFFGYRFGDLPYRSLRFEHSEHDGDHQGTAIVSYPDVSVPWTRTTEHAHFTFARPNRSVVTREHPRECGRGDVPYYPIDDAESRALLGRYEALARESGVIFGGRLGSFRYMDMDAVIGQALKAARQELGPPQPVADLLSVGGV